jgi:hypothetical protein
MPYLGNTPTTQSFISGTDYFNGTGSQTAFTLSRTPGSVNDIQAVVNNVVQVPNDAYTLSGTTITFTSAPSSGTNNVYVRYLSTTTQSITPSQGTVGWAQLNSDTQQDLGISFKNRIINGAMMIDQRNSGASVTPSTTGFFPVDRFRLGLSGSTGSKYSFQQSTDAPVGFKNSILATVVSAYSVTSTDIISLSQNIEGYNVADLGWGTANAKTVTLSFWVKSSVTGTFGAAIWCVGATTSYYPYTYTINSANTWEYKTVTVTGPTTNPGYTDNNAGLSVFWSLGVGSTYSGTANTWGTTQYRSVTGTVNLVATAGATWQVTGVQLEVGTQATTFDYRSYGTELALCQRYYRIIGQGAISVARATTQVVHGSSYQDMRAAPTAALLTTSPVFYNFATAANTTGSGSTINDSSLGVAAAQVNLTGFSGLTAGQSMSAVTTAITSLSAEL